MLKKLIVVQYWIEIRIICTFKTLIIQEKGNK